MSEIDSRRDLTAQYMGELQVAYDKIQLQLSVPAEGRPDAVAVPCSHFAARSTGRPRAGSAAGSDRPKADLGQRGQKRRRDRLDGGSAGRAGSRRNGRADAFTGLGTLVILDHGGNNYSLYGYLGSVTVQTGGQWKRAAKSAASGRRQLGRRRSISSSGSTGNRSILQWLKPR